MSHGTLTRAKKYLALLLSLIMSIGILPVIPSYATAPSSNATVSSSGNLYAVDNTGNTITSSGSAILVTTTVSSFLSNLTKDTNANWKITSSGAIVLTPSDFNGLTGKSGSDTISDNDKLAILAEDNTTLKVYSISVTSAPTLVSAETTSGGSIILLTFDKIMADPTGKHASFSVKLNGKNYASPVTQSITTTGASLNVDPHTIELGLQNPVYVGDVLTVSYSAGTVSAADSTVLASFTDQAVSNKVPYNIASNIPGTWIGYDHVGNWGEDPYPTGNDSRGNQYNKHIYIANGGSTIRFYGYGQPAYKDFLYLPNNDASAKSFSFTLNSSGVNYHSMEGGGFLFNTEVTAGKINGYAVLFRNGSVVLLQLNNVDAATFHETASGSMVGFAGITTLGTYTMPAGTLHNIKLETSSSSVDMWDTTNAGTTKVIDNISLPQVYSGGIGLIASYTSHGCNILSYFEFSNLDIKGVVNLSAALYQNTKANLTFSTLGDATSAVIEQSTDGINFTPATTENPLSLSDTTARAINLLPLTTYYFRIAVTGGIYAGYSKIGTAIFTPVPISDLAASAGDKTVRLTFSAPFNSSDVKVYKKAPTDDDFTLVTVSPSITGSTTSCDVNNLTNDVTYQFKIVVTGGPYDGTSNIATGTPRKPDKEPSTPSPVVTPTPDKQIIVIVNGKQESAGTEKSSVIDNRVLTNLVVNPAQVSNKIDEVIALNNTLPPAERIDNIVKIPVNEKTLDKLVVNITGDVVKKMEDNSFKMSIQQDMIEYIIPAKEITVSQVASKLGIPQDSLKNLEVQVRIAKSDSEQTAKFINSVESTSATVVVKPIEFEVVAKSTATDGKVSEVVVDSFTSYVERIVELPEGIDWSKITTGIVFNPDGTFTHVPTYVFMKDNKYFARLNSLTNSPYSIVWNPVTIPSVEKHWSKNYVNDMASRMVVSNTSTFAPDQAITRAMLADYLTRALGINRDGVAVEGQFKDVAKSNVYADAITQAVKYNLMTVDANRNFNPNGTMSRQDAMIIFERAMSVIALASGDLSRLNSYSDSKDVSASNNTSAKNVVSAKVFNGFTTAVMSPKTKLTQAESATAIRNMLLAAGLIDDYYKRVK